MQGAQTVIFDSNGGTCVLALDAVIGLTTDSDRMLVHTISGRDFAVDEAFQEKVRDAVCEFLAGPREG